MQSRYLLPMIFLVFGLTSCTTSFKDLSDDRDTIYEIDCSQSWLNDIANCKEKAKNLCRSGYETIGHRRSESFVTVQKTITVKCKK